MGLVVLEPEHEGEAEGGAEPRIGRAGGELEAEEREGQALEALGVRARLRLGHPGEQLAFDAIARASVGFGCAHIVSFARRSTIASHAR